MQLVNGEMFETLVAQIKRTFYADARLETPLAHARVPQLNIRTSMPLTRTSAWRRGGVAEFHGLLLCSLGAAGRSLSSRRTTLVHESHKPLPDDRVVPRRRDSGGSQRRNDGTAAPSMQRYSNSANISIPTV